ncbi:hypothetical protein SprV_0200686300 [Sparganum proliferum]
MGTVLSYGDPTVFADEVYPVPHGRVGAGAVTRTPEHNIQHDSSGRQGMAIAVSQQANHAVLLWKPVNDRLVYVGLKGHFTNIFAISVYASRPDAD